MKFRRKKDICPQPLVSNSRIVTRAQRFTLITALIVIVAALGAFLYLQLRPEPSLSVQDGGYEGQPALGSARAPVKLILFENFLCERCKVFETEVFGPLKRDYIDTGKVEAYYVNLAWGDETAVTAGRAGECAFEQDAAAFWDYKTALFAAQGADGWATLENLLTVAEGVEELEPAELRTCITEGQTQSEVIRDMTLADYVGVTGTPSVIIGNQGFEAPSFDDLKAQLDVQLAVD